MMTRWDATIQASKSVQLTQFGQNNFGHSSPATLIQSLNVKNILDIPIFLFRRSRKDWKLLGFLPSSTTSHAYSKSDSFLFALSTHWGGAIPKTSSMTNLAKKCKGRQPDEYQSSCCILIEDFKKHEFDCGLVNIETR